MIKIKAESTFADVYVNTDYLSSQSLKLVRIFPGLDIYTPFPL